MATVDLHELLGDHKTQPDAFRVHLCRAHQLAELLTEQRYLLRCDAFASVDHLDSDQAKLCVIPSHNIDLYAFSVGELEGVAHDVNQHLLKTLLVALQFLRQDSLA